MGLVADLLTYLLSNPVPSLPSFQSQHRMFLDAMRCFCFGCSELGMENDEEEGSGSSAHAIPCHPMPHHSRIFFHVTLPVCLPPAAATAAPHRTHPPPPKNYLPACLLLLLMHSFRRCRDHLRNSLSLHHPPPQPSRTQAVTSYRGYYSYSEGGFFKC